MAKARDNEIDLRVLMGQLNVMKWLFGILIPAVLAVAVWGYGQSAELIDLKGKVEFQRGEIAKHESKIDKSASNLGKMSYDIHANKIHLEHIKEMVKEITNILKGKHLER